MRRTTERGLVSSGYWCERYVYRSRECEAVTSWTFAAVHSAATAVRHIADDARRLSDGCALWERDRVRRVLDGPESTEAALALRVGAARGLTLACGATWVEWSARPVRFLRLVDRTGPSCAGLIGSRGGDFSGTFPEESPPRLEQHLQEPSL
ncbi:hypothetical protein [Streptomyces benahoarensis]|uniref:hypothetical protein n=1 Tax=Streptomyces benahoarensis TaxID=2595054 RepID=UPI00163D4957|nr:hypothetical protein [Streptomyces benahoarensis]